MNRLALMLLLVSLCVAGPALGEAGDQYSAVVPLPNVSETARNAAIKRGLEQVLIRLTGQSDIAAEPAAARLLADASDYALRFGFVELDDQQRGLSVTFTGAEIERYLRQHQLPIWPQQRMPILVWLVRETGGRPPAFVTQDEDEVLYDQLSQQFAVRGMPVRYPLYDFEDLLSLSAEEAWTFDIEQIAPASERYDVAQWLVVRCYETSGGEWRVAWMLGGDDADLQNLVADSLDDGLARVVDKTVDEIAAEQRFIPSSYAQRLVMGVAGIESHGDYSDLMDLVANMPMVKSVALQQIAGKQVSLTLEIGGERQRFVDALAHYDRLSPVREAAAGETGAGEIAGSEDGSAAGAIITGDRLAMRWRRGAGSQ